MLPDKICLMTMAVVPVLVLILKRLEKGEIDLDDGSAALLWVFM
jgi:hypothetical protein